MTHIAVAPGTRIRGFDGVRKYVKPAYQVLELHEALEREYRHSDAHLVMYVVPGLKWQPRINKSGLASFGRAVEIGVLFCDIDNPKHAAWTDETMAAAIEDYGTLEILETAGVYLTKHGARVVQPLDQPIPVEEAEPHLRHWLLRLSRAGLDVDWKCIDWTRHFRLPNVYRQGSWYRTPWMHLENMRPIALPPLPEVSPWEVLESKPASPGQAHTPTAPMARRVLDWTTDVPSQWHEGVKLIAEAALKTDDNWHALFMAIAGALLSRQVPPEHVPAICRAISIATGNDSRTEDRELSAKTTVHRWSMGQPATGYTQLMLHWPEVAEAIDEVTATRAEAQLHVQASAAATKPTLPLEETTAALEEAIRTAPDGLTLIGAECGLGKTHAATRVAKERAAKPHASKNAKGTRAPLSSKTSISVDKNDLARQIQASLTEQGVPVKRLFGPLSVLGADGTPVCQFHEAGKHLVAGGQSMQRELCEGRGKLRCAHYESCTARDGCEGPKDARIAIGPHALISALDGAAGSTGLLVIDEPPHVLNTTALTLDDLDLAESMLSSFDYQYVHALAPALQAVRGWLEAAVPSNRLTMPLVDGVRLNADAVAFELLTRAQDTTAVEDGDVVACAVAASMPDERTKAPPLRMMEVQRARMSPAYAYKIGAASGVLRLIHQGLLAKDRVVGTVEQRKDKQVLLVTSTRPQLASALKRDGAVIIMDANVELNAPIYEAAVGYKPPLHAFAAGDGAPITRCIIRCSSATRTRWIPSGKLLAAPSLINAVRVLMEWIKEVPETKTVGLITMKPIRLALDAILHPSAPDAQEAWLKAGQDADVLCAIREGLQPLLSAWGGTFILGHYGAVRGLNHMADVDALVTLGDAWPNIGQVRHDMDYLGLPDEQDERSEGLCRAELEQAHGRLRTVHRTRPGRALHVGRVLPSGSGWCGGNVDIRRMPVGRPKSEAAPMPMTAMSREELDEIVVKLGGVSAAARAAGCNRSHIGRCRSGKKGISEELAEKLRSALGA